MSGRGRSQRAPECGHPAFALVEMIDINFDFRFDTPPGKDPDTFSPTLRTYHQLLWSKPLPGGLRFELDVSGPPFTFITARSSASSGCRAIRRYRTSSGCHSSLISSGKLGANGFGPIGYTIGGRIVFRPGASMAR